MSKFALPSGPWRAHSPWSEHCRLAGLGLVIVAAGCTPGGSTTYEEAVTEFVDAWDQAGVVCERYVVCMNGMPGPCEAASRPSEDIVDAVYLAHFDIQAIGRCEDSAAVYGSCLGTLDCVTLQQAHVLCAAEHQRYYIDCAALLVALDYIEAGGGGGGPASGGSVGSGGIAGGTGGGSSAPGGLVQAFCERAEACTGVRWTDEQTAACGVQAAPLFGPLIPDAAGTEACLAAAACSELEANVTGVIAGCVDLDPASAQCLDARAIRVCTSSGVCSDLPCRQVCASTGTISLGCGPSPTGGGDACQCG